MDRLRIGAPRCNETGTGYAHAEGAGIRFWKNLSNRFDGRESATKAAAAGLSGGLLRFGGCIENSLAGRRTFEQNRKKFSWVLLFYRLDHFVIGLLAKSIYLFLLK
jgi:hypothetical protein